MTSKELISVSIDIDAPISQVWGLVSDLKRMGEWSPQCHRMFIRGGDVKLGTKTLNINRDGNMWWPTQSQVIEFEPNKRIAFKIIENWTIWTYELEEIPTGTRVVQSRATPRGTSGLSKFLVDKFMNGPDRFESRLERGMMMTLERMKSESEGARA